MQLQPLFAQQLTKEQESAAMAGAAISGIVCLGIAILMIASLWVLFSKAGKPGWASIIPIYNVIVMLQIAGKPIWWLLLLLIPFVNFVIGIIVILSFAKAYGKGAGFAVGMIFLPFIFYPILAFGSSRYRPIEEFDDQPIRRR